MRQEEFIIKVNEMFDDFEVYTTYDNSKIPDFRLSSKNKLIISIDEFMMIIRILDKSKAAYIQEYKHYESSISITLNNFMMNLSSSRS